MHYTISYSDKLRLIEACKVGDVETVKTIISTLTDLVLHFLEIEAPGVPVIAEAVKENKRVVSLYQDNIYSGAHGAKAIAEALEDNNTLIQLSLGYNKIGDDGAKAIAGTFKGNNSLRVLDLRFNNIGDEGAKAIAGAFKGNNSLRVLDLRFNKIGDEGAKAIAGAFKGNNSLRTLELRFNNIGDEGVKAIAGAFKCNNALINLSLRANNIRNDGAKAIAEALKGNNALTNLTLLANHIGDDGAKAIIDALKLNVTLTECDLFDSGSLGAKLLYRNKKIAKEIEGVKNFITDPVHAKASQENIDWNQFASLGEDVETNLLKEKVFSKLINMIANLEESINPDKLDELAKANGIIKEVKDYVLEKEQIKEIFKKQIDKLLQYNGPYHEKLYKKLEAINQCQKITTKGISIVDILDNHSLVVHLGLHKNKEFLKILASDGLTVADMFCAELYEYELKNGPAKLSIKISVRDLLLGARELFRNAENDDRFESVFTRDTEGQALYHNIFEGVVETDSQESLVILIGELEN